MVLTYKALFSKLSLFILLLVMGMGCSTSMDLVTKPPNFNSDNYYQPTEYGIKNATAFLKKPDDVIASSEFVPARVEGGIRVLMNNVRYPYKSRSQYQEGKVYMKLFIDETGEVQFIRVLSSPDERLTTYSVYAVQNTDFLPATLNNSPVKSTRLVMFNFNFKLNNEVNY